MAAGDEKANIFRLRILLGRCNFPQVSHRLGFCSGGFLSYHPATVVRIAGFMDTLSRVERSKRMALVRGKDTKPELLVRKIVRSCGYRFRLNVSNLPGKPDIVFPNRRKAIFVHGCFWHRHPGCDLARLPKSRRQFWVPKLQGNRRRDVRNIEQLRREKWKVCVVWECQLRKITSIEKKIRKFLEKNDAKR